MIRLITDAPQFFSDLGDVLRLFYGDVQVSLTEGETVFEHRFTDAGGLWTDTWTSQGKTCRLSEAAVSASALEVKRLRKRQVKLALYNLLKELTGMQPPGAASPASAPRASCTRAWRRGFRWMRPWRTCSRPTT